MAANHSNFLFHPASDHSRNKNLFLLTPFKNVPDLIVSGLTWLKCLSLNQSVTREKVMSNANSTQTILTVSGEEVVC